MKEILEVKHEFKSVGYTLSVKKKTVKSDQYFSGDQYISPVSNFTRLKLTPTKIFSSYFLLNRNYGNVKKNYQIYHTIVWLSGVG